MTSDQLDPSAQASCTNTTLRASTGAAVWAFASTLLNDPASAQTAPVASVGCDLKVICCGAS
jgi:hypothetical protein